MGEEASDMTEVPNWFASATAGLPLNPVRVTPIATDQYPTAGRRPPYSVLSNLLLKETFGVEMKDWRAQLHDAFREAPDLRNGNSNRI